ncbi:MAG: efflux RND transporter periplasmic adaptor subunit [Brevundimonas sp.]|uniref:efflux RND transporter periplasmic adaptor subunit n=1 Tax=Brevundimonas sp. TaxID=1871086 RepID=UPI00391B8E3A
MLKRHFFIFAAAGVVALMVAAAVLRIAFAGDEAGGAGPGGPRGAQEVSEVQVVSRTFSDRIEVLGVARGRRSVDITSNATELITRVYFTDGQRVAAGAPLVQLRADQQDAGIIEAEARLQQARRDMERWEALAERGIAPRVTAEQARTDFDLAQASLEAAQARRGERMIRAPFAGVLGLSTVTAGTLVNPGAVIATLDDISVIRVDFPVPERYLPILSSGTPITARAEAYPDREFSGQIAQLDTRVDPQTRAMTARAEFANTDGAVRPGMSMRVSVRRGDRPAPAVPEAAVQYQGSGAFVYRIASDGERSTAQRVEVQTGVVENGMVEIVSGLSAGDRVIGSGLNRIQPGAAVQVARTTPPGAPAADDPSRTIAP